MSFAVAILGGGFAGWALQDALQAQGLPASQILLLERDLSGSGSSGVLRGMMHPFTGRSLFPRPGYLAAWHFSRRWFAALQDHSGQRLYSEMPLWRLAFTPDAARQFARSFERARSALPDYPLQLTAPPEGLTEGVLGAYGLSPALQVNLPLVLAQLAARSGVTSALRLNALQVQHTGNHWCLQHGASTWRAERLVFACGQALKQYFPALSLSAKRGEVVIARARHALPGMLSGGGVYIAPLDPERLILGATFYHAGRPWAPAQSWQRLRQRFDWLPVVQSAEPLQIWSGVRAVVQPDREALLGPVPGLANAWVMAGFGTRGLLQIPLAAQELAAALLHQAPVSPTMAAERLPEDAWCFTPRPDRG